MMPPWALRRLDEQHRHDLMAEAERARRRRLHGPDDGAPLSSDRHGWRAAWRARPGIAALRRRSDPTAPAAGPLAAPGWLPVSEELRGVDPTGPDDQRAVDVARRLIASLDAPWSPRMVARTGHQEIKVVMVHGESDAHVHSDCDAVFLVTSGRLVVHLPRRTVALEAGQLLVVPRGTEHCSIAETETRLVLIESCAP